MNLREDAVQFECAGEMLTGVVARPPSTPFDVGVVVVVGGPQYRVGSHRQFVQLARRLAEAGYAALRFDMRGMGDSGGSAPGFEGVTSDIGAAIDALAAFVPEVRKVVLWGLCDGASAALLYLHERPDPRVRGLCLLNPWVRTEATLAKSHIKHYYTRRLREREFWLKFLRGGIAWQAIKELLRNATLARVASQAQAPTIQQHYTQRMALGWLSHQGPLLLVLSGNDYTAKEFDLTLRNDPAWQRAAHHEDLQRLDVPDADHSFSEGATRIVMEERLLRWLGDRVQGFVDPFSPGDRPALKGAEVAG